MTARICVYLVSMQLHWEWQCTYTLLEFGQISWGESVGLGYHWDEIDTGTQPLHDLNVQWLESVAGGTDEVQACMHTQIDLLRSARLLLLKHVALVLVIQELNDGLP
jgi:hypothetical protein